MLLSPVGEDPGLQAPLGPHEDDAHVGAHVPEHVGEDQGRVEVSAGAASREHRHWSGRVFRLRRSARRSPGASVAGLRSPAPLVMHRAPSPGSSSGPRR